MGDPRAGQQHPRFPSVFGDNPASFLHAGAVQQGAKLLAVPAGGAKLLLRAAKAALIGKSGQNAAGGAFRPKFAAAKTLQGLRAFRNLPEAAVRGLYVWFG